MGSDVAYDWDIIAGQRNSEEAYYRLLGEMLRRRASGDDLLEVRNFLSSHRLEADVWLSLGEGLFHTTDGASIGYRMWGAWSRYVLRTEFSEARQLAAWRRFQRNASTAAGTSTEPPRTPPENCSREMLPLLRGPEPRTDRIENTRIVVQREAIGSGPSTDPNLRIALIPSGPYTVKIFGRVCERVDEFKLSRLVELGVFFELEILFGARWLSVHEHPGFVSLIHALRKEALAELATMDAAPAEVTRPDARLRRVRDSLS